MQEYESQSILLGPSNVVAVTHESEYAVVIAKQFQTGPQECFLGILVCLRGKRQE